MRQILVPLLIGSLVVLLGGCGSLPSSGPSPSRIKSNAASPNDDGFYQLVETTQSVIETLRDQEWEASPSGLATLAAPPLATSDQKRRRASSMSRFASRQRGTIQSGDILDVTIFSSGGLFAAPSVAQAVGSLPTQIPPQRVDDSGAITVPFAGRIPVRGKTLHEVEQDILTPLMGKAIDPHVVVSSPEESGGKMVSIIGDVEAPQRIGIPFSGLRVIDAIAAAGGAKNKAYETVVTVTRDGHKASALLGDIYDKPSQNIHLQPGDTLVLSGRKWTFTTLGAIGQRTHTFENSEIKLVEALGLSGGLFDSQANPRGVFVFRFETPATVRSLGRDRFTETSSGVPVVYLFNLARPQQMFAAAQFAIRDQDTIFVGNAGTVGLMKALDLFNAITAPARSGLSTAAGFETLSN